MNHGLLVVGGGPAGLSAASAYREAGGTGPVHIVSADDHPPYNRPFLTKDYLRGDAEEHDLPLQPDSYYADNDIVVTLARTVEQLDPSARTVSLDNGEVVGYETCVLATGSRPAVLPVDGADHPGVLRLRSLVQGQALRRAAETASTAIVVGSGFIGCEAAASLAKRGLQVTLISRESQPQVERLGEVAASRIAGWLTDAGVRLVLDAGVGAVEEARRVVLDDGSSYTADLVLTAAGIEPRAQLATDAGVAVEDGRIVVDERMRTSVVGLYAVGDVAFARNGSAGRHLVVEHYGEALAMGEIAGSNAAGSDATWSQAPGFWTEIGPHTLKYASWGDGYDDLRVVEHGDGAFTVWYGANGVTVGVLSHEADDDYERGSRLVERAAPFG